MIKWTNGIMTEKGLALQAKLHSGTTLSITRAAVGAGIVTVDEIPSLTSVPDERQALIFSTKIYSEDHQCVIPLRLDNTGLSEGYTGTIIGVYAFDPDEGEILYTATVTEGNGIEVPPGAESVYAAVWNYYIKYGQADAVSITVNPAASATVDEIQAIIDAHADDGNNPHGVTAEQLGLGNVDNTADSEKHVAYASTAGTANATKNNLVVRLKGGRTEGTDQFTFDGSAGKSINLTPANLGFAPAVVSADYPGCYYRTVDGETEWINPPMQGNKEYRTTERFKGKPVYTKLIGMIFSSGVTSVLTQTALVLGASNLWVESSRYDTGDGLLEDSFGSMSTVTIHMSVGVSREITVTCDLMNYDRITVWTQVKYTQ